MTSSISVSEPPGSPGAYCSIFAIEQQILDFSYNSVRHLLIFAYANTDRAVRTYRGKENHVSFCNARPYINNSCTCMVFVRTYSNTIMYCGCFFIVQSVVTVFAGILADINDMHNNGTLYSCCVSARSLV